MSPTQLKLPPILETPPFLKENSEPPFLGVIKKTLSKSGSGS